MITNIHISKLSSLAIAGILGASVADEAVAAEGGETASDGTVTKADGKQYLQVHDCAGLNVCRGLGGCHVSEEKLKKLIKQAGYPEGFHTKGNECAGHNACKGLGGCKVTKEKFEKLVAKKAAIEKKYAKSETHTCAGHNVCKGLGGCKVSAEKLEKLANAHNVPTSLRGKAHDCAGLNACKGLGGCHVSEEKFTKLKKMQSAANKYKEVHDCAGLTSVKVWAAVTLAKKNLKS